MVRGSTRTSDAGPIKYKAWAGAAYAILIVALAGPSAVSSAVTAPGSENCQFASISTRPARFDEPAQANSSAAPIELDKFGMRGPVSFNHDNHAARQNPDPNAVFKTKPGASCSGCHHTLDRVSGAPQLWKCSGCHRNSGDLKNPKGRDGDEQWSETAYHNLCIGCHVASTKGPVKCGDCHQLRAGQR